MVLRIQSPEWLSAEQVASLLGVSVQTVHNRAAQRKFPRPRVQFDIPQTSVQRKMRWAKADVEEFLNGYWIPEPLLATWGEQTTMFEKDEEEAL